MINIRCIQKYRDNNNKIVGYLLQSEDGVTKSMTPHELKHLMLTNQVHVENMKLTTDEKLIEDTSYKSQHSVNERIHKLTNRITHDTGIKFNQNVSMIRINDNDFYMEAKAVGNSPLVKIGIKSNRNIIKLMYKTLDDKGNIVNSYKHVKFDREGYNKILSIINSR
jgi:hypothetical protein